MSGRGYDRACAGEPHIVRVVGTLHSLQIGPETTELQRIATVVRGAGSRTSRTPRRSTRSTCGAHPARPCSRSATAQSSVSSSTRRARVPCPRVPQVKEWCVSPQRISNSCGDTLSHSVHQRERERERERADGDERRARAGGYPQRQVLDLHFVISS